MLLLYVELFYLILTNTTGDVFLLVCLLFPGSSSASLQGSCHDTHTHMLVQAYTTSSASFHLSKVHPYHCNHSVRSQFRRRYHFLCSYLPISIRDLPVIFRIKSSKNMWRRHRLQNRPGF
ncbi:hypothetical protein C8J55DRAFT_124482 [Lentinula edodes]|uniref:Uncharacterized protein n=1 Tax=Lentinula lateritia TaxID=40482 RepID=A0A9W9A760_9AGAR|nr:hypothetical protein C8J55DRAFT_124482 [Lentinula edodes]